MESESEKVTPATFNAYLRRKCAFSLPVVSVLYLRICSCDFLTRNPENLKSLSTYLFGKQYCNVLLSC